MKQFYIFFFLILTNLTFAQPANDTCNNAEPITVSSELTTINFDLSDADLNNEPGCDGTVTSYADVWYSFTMPFDGNVVIDGDISWNNIGATNACNGNLLACDSAALVLTNISANTNVLLRIFRTLSLADNPQFTSFTIRAFETPVNDSCNASINIPLGILQQQVIFDIGGSDLSNNNGCSDNTTEYADVWYDFNMPFDGNLYLDSGIVWNKFEIYNTCTGTSIYCGEEDLLAVGLTNNTNYKIRVYRNLQDMFTTTFLSFNILAYQATSNDDCDSAIPLNLSQTPTTITTPFLGGSTIENTTGCTTDIMDYLDIWYTFTLGEEGDVSIDSGTVWNHFELYDTCNGNIINCFTEDGTFTNLSAGTYYLRFFRELAFATSPTFKDFDISSTAESLSTSDWELNSIKVFPNPATDYISIKSSKQLTDIDLYDVLGKKVLSFSMRSTIPVNNLPNGMYILKISTEDTQVMKTIIKH